MLAPSGPKSLVLKDASYVWCTIWDGYWLPPFCTVWWKCQCSEWLTRSHINLHWLEKRLKVGVSQWWLLVNVAVPVGFWAGQQQADLLKLSSGIDHRGRICGWSNGAPLGRARDGQYSQFFGGFGFHITLDHGLNSLHVYNCLLNKVICHYDGSSTPNQTGKVSTYIKFLYVSGYLTSQNQRLKRCDAPMCQGALSLKD